MRVGYLCSLPGAHAVRDPGAVVVEAEDADVAHGLRHAETETLDMRREGGTSGLLQQKTRLHPGCACPVTKNGRHICLRHAFGTSLPRHATRARAATAVSDSPCIETTKNDS